MRSSLSAIIVFFSLAGGAILLHAQNAAPAPAQGSHEAGAISFLTPEQREQYAKAHAKALADNPALKSEGEDLLNQGQTALTSGTAADKQAFVEKMDSHRQKLRKAMLKEDSTLGPIFAEIDKHISELKAKQLGQVQSSSPAPNSH